jgi:hypothetical protein
MTRIGSSPERSRRRRFCEQPLASILVFIRAIRVIRGQTFHSGSCHDFPHDVSADIRPSEVATRLAIGEGFGVEAHPGKQSGVQVHRV